MKIFKRILSMILVISMVLSIAVTGVVAEDDYETVTTIEVLVEKLGTLDAKIKLGADLDFGSYEKYPIAVAAGVTLDGAGHKLTNVKVGSKGLFDLSACDSEEEKATFKNFTVGEEGTPATATSTDSVGALICVTTDFVSYYTDWSKVDVYASIELKAGSDIGVYYAKISGVHTFENCKVTLNFTGTGAGNANAVGGFIGRTKATAGNIRFTDCVSDGNIVNGSNVGGYIGKSDVSNAPVFTNCINNADVKSTTSHAGNAAGGFVGYSNPDESETDLTYTGCENNGVVTTTFATTDGVTTGAKTGHFHGTHKV